jgi:hypothetical protein
VFWGLLFARGGGGPSGPGASSNSASSTSSFAFSSPCTVAGLTKPVLGGARKSGRLAEGLGIRGGDFEIDCNLMCLPPLRNNEESLPIESPDSSSSLVGLLLGIGCTKGDSFGFSLDASLGEGSESRAFERGDRSLEETSSSSSSS